MAESDSLYQLEVKLPSENGVVKTQVINLKTSGQAVFKHRMEFPNIGDSTLLYVATNENKIYKWNAESLIYDVIGSDYHDIETIDCGGAA